MDMKACIDACTECRTTCLITLGHCLALDGENVKADRIDALLDCITLCASGVDLMARNSPLCGRNCAVCAEACRRCAELCEATPRDVVMQRCAKICRECETTCTVMAAHYARKSKALHPIAPNIIARMRARSENDSRIESRQALTDGAWGAVSGATPASAGLARIFPLEVASRPRRAGVPRLPVI